MANANKIAMEARFKELADNVRTETDAAGRMFAVDATGKKYEIDATGRIEIEEAGRKIKLDPGEWLILAALPKPPPRPEPGKDGRYGELALYKTFLSDANTSGSSWSGGPVGGLMFAIYYCLREGLPIPEWAGSEFQKLFSLTTWGYLTDKDGAPSWDAAFGKAPRLKTNSEAYLDLMRAPVYQACMRRKEKGEPLNDATFEEIGREFGVGGTTTVKRLYKEYREGVVIIPKGVRIIAPWGSKAGMARVRSLDSRRPKPGSKT